MKVQKACPQNECSHRVRIALALSGKNLAQHGERVSGGIGEDPGKGRSDLDCAPPGIGLGIVQILPFVELHLRGDGFEREAEFGPKVEGADGDTAIEVLQFGGSAIGPADGFPLGAFDGVAQDAAGAEEEGHGIEVPAELLLAGFGHVFGEGVEL